MGTDEFLKSVHDQLDFTSIVATAEAHEPRLEVDRFAHIGVHKQQQPGLNYIGVALRVGHMTAGQMQALANLSQEHGDGFVRFTIWQNLILGGVPDSSIATVRQELSSLGFETKPSKCISGLAACTGNQGCKLSLTDTKRHAGDIADHFEKVLPNGPPLGIVLTGCPNSCAQHFCADIGLLGVKTKVDGESVEAYTITLGGGTDQDQGLGREFAKAVPHAEVPALLERVVNRYQEEQEDDETFLQFVRRHDADALKSLAQVKPVNA